MRQEYFIGDTDARRCLIQPVDIRDREFLNTEYEMIRAFCPGEKVLLAAFEVNSWNQDLSPWEAPPVFGKEAFGAGAADTLKYIADKLIPEIKTRLQIEPGKVRYMIGGYSLAGLFALWAVFQTDLFSACAAASPSVWFPGWIDYAKTHGIRTDKIYLSLGDREARTKNPVMKTVADCIREQAELLKEKKCILEWNQGNHFQNAEERTAKAFAWCINE